MNFSGPSDESESENFWEDIKAAFISVPINLTDAFINMTNPRYA